MYSRAVYSGTGAASPYAVPFPYLDASHVEVRVNDVLQDPSTYSWTSSASLSINAPAGSLNVDIRRNTPAADADVTFSDGSTLTEADLNLQVAQLLYVYQEQLDASDLALGIMSGGVFNALGRRIVNLGYPQNETDAATLGAARDIVEQITAGATGALGTFIQNGTGAVSRTFQDKMREQVSVHDFGAVGDGVADDTAAFQLAVNSLSSGGVVKAPRRYYISSTLNIPKNVTIRGSQETPEVARGTSSYDSANSQIVLNSAATLSFADASGMIGMQVLNKTLVGQLPFASAGAATAAVAAFAGTAITVAGDGTYFSNVLVLGFNTALYSTGRQRITVQNCHADCTNGFDIQSAADVCRVLNSHCWPYLTGYLPFAAGTALVTRSGFAFRYKGVADWSVHENCSHYGFFNGYLYDSVDSVLSVGCASDYPVGQAVNGSGFSALNNCTNLLLMAPRAEGHSYGVFVQTTNSGSTVGAQVSVVGGKFWSLGLAGVRVQTGSAVVLDNVFYNILGAAQGVSMGAGAIQNGPCKVANNIFDAVAIPLGVDASGIGYHDIHGNTLRNCVDASVGDQRIFNNSTSQIAEYVYSSSSTGPLRRTRKARGAVGAPTLVSGGDIVGMWQMDAYDGSAWQPAAAVRGIAAGTPAASAMPGRLIFSVNRSSTALTDTTVIDETGALKGVTDNAYPLGSATLRWSTVYAATGTINTSDSRTKTDVTNATLGLDFVKSLRPVSYKFDVGRVEVVKQVYRDSEGNECDSSLPDAIPAEIVTAAIPGERTHWGLIAQEVKAAADAAGVDFGGWTLADKSDPNSQQGLRYDQFIAPLIKAVQELSAEVAALKAAAPQ
jgi:hypothetical protein